MSPFLILLLILIGLIVFAFFAIWIMKKIVKSRLKQGIESFGKQWGL